MRLLAERNGLRHHVQASDDDGTAEGDEGAEGLECLADLRCQFASGSQDEAEERLRLVEQRLQHGQRKRRRLSATSLGQTDDITPLQSDGDGLFLDRRRKLVVERLARLAKCIDDSLETVSRGDSQRTQRQHKLVL